MDQLLDVERDPDRGVRVALIAQVTAAFAIAEASLSLSLMPVRHSLTAASLTCGVMVGSVVLFASGACMFLCRGSRAECARLLP